MRRWRNTRPSQDRMARGCSPNPPTRAPNPQATRGTRRRAHPSSITLRSPLHEPFPLTNDARTIRTGRAVWGNVNRRASDPQEARRPAAYAFSTLFQHAQALNLRLSARFGPFRPSLSAFCSCCVLRGCWRRFWSIFLFLRFLLLAWLAGAGLPMFCRDAMAGTSAVALPALGGRVEVVGHGDGTTETRFSGGEEVKRAGTT